jgi:hypothetical protein
LFLAGIGYETPFQQLTRMLAATVGCGQPPLRPANGLRPRN